MAQQVTVTAKGLYTSPNQLGEVPDGALRQADNVVISKDGVIQPRRGAATVSTKGVRRLFPYNGIVLGHNPSTDTLSYSNAAVTSWTDATGTCAEGTAGPLRFADVASEAFVTNSTGTQRFDGASNSIFTAGLPRAPDPVLALSTPAGTALANNKSVAYRVTWAVKDGYGRTIESSPSGRVIISNTSGGLKDVTVTVPIPIGVPSGAYARVYRSVAVDTTATPSDEMYLAFEGNPVTTAASVLTDITGAGPYTCTTAANHNLATGMWALIYNGRTAANAVTGAAQVTVTSATQFTIATNLTGTTGVTGSVVPISFDVSDIAPDDVLTDSLYTSPSQGGMVLANDQPPIASDVAVFRGSMFFADTAAKKYSVIMQMVAANTGQITVGPIRFISGVAENPVISAAVPGVAQYQLYATGSPASDIANTCASLVRVANRVGRYADQGVLTNTLAAFLISGDNDPPGMVLLTSDSSFTVQQYSGYTSTTWIPDILRSALAASRDEFRNALFWSKDGQPDHVPALNYARIGSDLEPILRIVPTRDALFVFKNDGVWRLTGTGGVWDIQPLDPTTSLVSLESPVPFENAVFALCDSGVMRITESGVENISGPIYSDLEPLLLPSVLSTTASVSFGIAYHSDHKYILWMPSAAGDTVAKQAFVYDSWTNSWERWTPPSGVTGFYHGLVNPADDRLYMTDGTNIWQERRTGSSADHTDGASSAITTTVKWAPRVGGNPGAMHRFREVSLHFRKVQFGTATLGFSTDVSPNEETITLSGSEYGCDTAERGQTVIRALVPLEKARGSQLNIRFSSANAGMGYELEGMSVVFNPGSTRVGR